MRADDGTKGRHATRFASPALSAVFEALGFGWVWGTGESWTGQFDDPNPGAFSLMEPPSRKKHGSSFGEGVFEMLDFAFDLLGVVIDVVPQILSTVGHFILHALEFLCWF